MENLLKSSLITKNLAISSIYNFFNNFLDNANNNVLGNNKKKIWENVKNNKINFNKKVTNINLFTSRLFNNGFFEFLKFYGFKLTKDKNTFITSGNNTGKYSLNFSKTNINRSINKVSLSKWCKNSPYYPKSIIINNTKEYNNIKWNNNLIYFIKPWKGEGSKNIAISRGKNVIINKDSIKKMPLIVQESVKNMRLNNGCKEDERIYVLFIKDKNGISSYLYNITIERKSKFKYNDNITKKSYFTLPCNMGNVSEKKIKFSTEINSIIPLVKDISQKLIPNLNKKLFFNHSLEFWLTGWDIIFDNSNKPWLLEINPTPNQCETIYIRNLHYAIYQEILEIIDYYDKNNTIKTLNFIKVL